MIEQQDYRLPKPKAEQSQPSKSDEATEHELYDLGFRPFGYEW